MKSPKFIGEGIVWDPILGLCRRWRRGKKKVTLDFILIPISFDKIAITSELRAWSETIELEGLAR